MTPFLIFVGGWAIRTAIVTAVASTVCALAHRSSGAQQNWIWRTCLLATTFIAFTMLVGPKIEIPISVYDPSGDSRASELLGNSKPSNLVPGTISGPQIHTKGVAQEHSNYREEDSRSTPWDYFAGITYLFGIGIVLIRWIVSIAKIRRFCGDAQPFDGSQAVLLSNAVDLRIPFAFGWRRPVIILPPNAWSWSAERLEAVLLHERAHVKRNDWIWQSAATINTAIQWFNPTAWVIGAKLRSTAEISVDDEVVASGVLPTNYAKHLMAFAIECGPTFSAAIGMARAHGISSRIRRILSQNINRGKFSRRYQFIGTLLFGLAGIFLSALTPTALASSLIQIPTSGPSDSSRWEIKLSNGATVRLRFIGSGSSSKLPTWNPDGSPSELTPAIYGQSYSSGEPGPGKICVAVCYEVIAQKSMSENQPTRTIGHDSAKLSGVMSRSGGAGPQYAIRSFIVPDTGTTSEFRVGVGTGDFRKLAENRPGKEDFKIKVKETTRQVHFIGTDAQGKSTEKTIPKSVCELTFELPTKADNKEWRLAAYDSNGKELATIVTFGGFPFPIEGESIRTWHAQLMAPAEKVAKYAIEGRNYAWAVFRGVHLYPDHRR